MDGLVLVLTALEDVTADMVITALNELGAPVARVDPADLGNGLLFGARIGAGPSAWRGRLRTPSREIELEEVAAVYYRRPTPYATRFAHLPAQQRDFAAAEARHGLGGIVNNLTALYVNHPAAVTRADFKPAQLQRFAELGLRIPPTLVTNDVDQARAFAGEHGPIIYKTFRGLPPAPDGRAGAIWAQRVDLGTFDDSLAVTAHLFQAEVPKTGDVRVTIVGDQVFAQQITTPDGALDWRRGDWEDLLHTPITVPGPIAIALHRYLASFELVFGCFDFALTGPPHEPEQWVAIECNPNGQWGWLPDAPAIADALARVLNRKEAALHGDTTQRG
ncbi:ATP-grasp ribosomal peptide maturase [Actinoallomurus purpureus]|uniref:ATP-grasp ribosomal peptide maturase n=1 Tax=Actinoallomurus purpureus TaxID=478114 RepID=UPI002091F834|nr:ATP-grasp ribosomal peptide maturase [Actinoallomurus purpureus]MCO6009331.1 ATP-grasp ribosomal peptide maturase [Actinoallomurus purpureus]